MECGGDIGHECGFALLRLLHPPEYYETKYGSHFFALRRMQLLLEKQRNRGQDGAGMSCIKLDVEPGYTYINCDKSVAKDPIRDLFERVQTDASAKLAHRPDSAYGRDPKWVKTHVPYTGEVFLGHVRYSTDSDDCVEHCHPIYRESNWKTRNLLLAGNFNITNNEELFEDLVALGQYPSGHSDTVTLAENIGHHLDRENNDLFVEYYAQGHSAARAFTFVAENMNIPKILRAASKNWDGGFCIAGVLGHGDAFVYRDPNGIRPAFYIHTDEICAVASERPLLQSVFGVLENVYPIPPGHALTIKKNGAVSMDLITPPPLPYPRQCSFERIYFSRGNDADVYREREHLGELLLDPVLKILEEDGDSFSNTVFSFVPNTSEIAYNGLTKAALKYVFENNLKANVRYEKVLHKDAKIRTFIQEDSTREALTSYAYDVHYGTVQRNEVIIALDDSIVRGNTLKNAILRSLDRLAPKTIIVVSSAPQIRYPDPYGIDMARFGDLCAFNGALTLLRATDPEDYLIEEIYEAAKAILDLPLKEVKENPVRRFYERFTDKQITDEIVKACTHESIKAKVKILFQSVTDLHKALDPMLYGDWYFTGDYPTPGGIKACCRAFVQWRQGQKASRCYGFMSTRTRTNRVLVLGRGTIMDVQMVRSLRYSKYVTTVYLASSTPLNTHVLDPSVASVHKADVLNNEAIRQFCDEKDIDLLVDLRESSKKPDVKCGYFKSMGSFPEFKHPYQVHVLAAVIPEGGRRTFHFLTPICVLEDGSSFTMPKEWHVDVLGALEKQVPQEFIGIATATLDSESKQVSNVVFGVACAPLLPTIIQFHWDIYLLLDAVARNDVTAFKAHVLEDAKNQVFQYGHSSTMLTHSPSQANSLTRAGSSEGGDNTDRRVESLAVVLTGSPLLETRSPNERPALTTLSAALNKSKVSVTGRKGRMESGCEIVVRNVTLTSAMAKRMMQVPGVEVDYTADSAHVSAEAWNANTAKERVYQALRSLDLPAGARYNRDIDVDNICHVESSCDEETQKNGTKNLTYLQSGVNMAAYAKALAAIQPLLNETRSKSTGPNFCDLSGIDLKSGKIRTVVQSIGTKLRVASDMGRYENIGLDLVAMCVNELVMARASPLFMLDYFATGKLEVDCVYQVTRGISEGCCKTNMALLDCNIAELPGLMISGAFDLAGFAVGMMKAPPAEAVTEDDVLIGLPSSGVHCNGFSLVRSALKSSGLSVKSRAPWQSHNSVGESLVTPTRIYDQVVSVFDKVKAIQNITRGGLFRMEFVPGHLSCVFQTGMWEFPAFYRWMLRGGRLSCAEMARTFNCGLGMVLCVRSDCVADVLETLKVLEPKVVGNIQKRPNGDAVILEDAVQNWMHSSSPEFFGEHIPVKEADS